MRTGFIVLSVLFFASCGTTSQPVESVSSGITGSQPVEPVLNETADSASFSVDEQQGYFISKPTGSALVIIGVSSRQRRREEEIASALDDAARKVAMYQGVRGKIAMSLTTGPGGFFGFHTDTVSDIVYDSDYHKYLDALIYDQTKDVLVTPDAVFVRVTYPVLTGSVIYTSEIIGGAPSWIHKPPQEISGYMAGVGFAMNQRWFQDTVTKSYESAITALLSRLSSQMTVHDIDGSNNTASQTVQIIEGELSRFLALEMWIDPVNKSVWTLAIARTKD
jgi:hypothetical protein